MDWAEAGAALRGPSFAPLAPLLARLPPERWPQHAELTALAAGARTEQGHPIRFVMPRDRAVRQRTDYESHIARTGEIETRPAHWHDLFNALAWAAFPRAKAAINAQHRALLAERGEAEALRRGPERDALTLFDEGGVAVISSDPEVFRRIESFEWKALFWDARRSLGESTRFVAFGHALHERMLAPFRGLVAKTVFLGTSDPGALDVDAALARHFADRSRFPRPRSMAPMPVLGIPGWHSGTAREDHYDDADQFRAKGRRPAQRAAG